MGQYPVNTRHFSLLFSLWLDFSAFEFSTLTYPTQNLKKHTTNAISSTIKVLFSFHRYPSKTQMPFWTLFSAIISYCAPRIFTSVYISIEARQGGKNRWYLKAFKLNNAFWMLSLIFWAKNQWNKSWPIFLFWESKSM